MSLCSTSGDEIKNRASSDKSVGLGCQCGDRSHRYLGDCGNASWGQASPLALAWRTLDAQQGDVTASSERIGQLQSAIDHPAATALKGNSEKARLAVNPVTGSRFHPNGELSSSDGKRALETLLEAKLLLFPSVRIWGPFLRRWFSINLRARPRNGESGFHGYGLRGASRTASAVVQGTVQAPLAALLHEDVQAMWQARTVGVNGALLHALQYSFLTFNSHGHPTP